MDNYVALIQWLPHLLIAVSFGGSLLFFLILFMLLRGLTRLNYLKEISTTLKRIESLLESKGKM
jgi:hypothetical protein